MGVFLLLLFLHHDLMWFIFLVRSEEAGFGSAQFVYLASSSAEAKGDYPPVWPDQSLRANWNDCYSVGHLALLVFEEKCI